MKVNFDIECTPEEARAFMGLPDVAPMQERLMKDMEDRVVENFNALSPEEIVKTWMPMTLQGWNEMQKMFWDQMAKSSGGFSSEKPAPSDKKSK